MSEPIQKVVFSITLAPPVYGGKISAINVVVKGVGMGGTAVAVPGDSIDIQVQLSGLIVDRGQLYKIGLTLADVNWTTTLRYDEITGIPADGWYFVTRSWSMPNMSVAGVIDLWPSP